MQEKTTTTGQKTSRVVFGLHGIRTSAKWQKAFAEVAQKRKLVPRINSWDFGYFSAARFLLPWAREKKLQWFRDTYGVEVKNRDVPLGEGESPSIVAHSFGTYLVAYALKRFPHLKFDRVLLCGAILPTDFDWRPLFDREQVRRLRVEYGVRDPWVKLAGWLVSGAGPAGARGFAVESDRVEQEEFEYDHSEYFGPGHMEDVWVPFLRGRDSDTPTLTPKPGPARPWLGYLLAVALLALIGWAAVEIPSFLAGLWEPNGLPVRNADLRAGDLETPPMGQPFSLVFPVDPSVDEVKVFRAGFEEVTQCHQFFTDPFRHGDQVAIPLGHETSKSLSRRERVEELGSARMRGQGTDREGQIPVGSLQSDRHYCFGFFLLRKPSDRDFGELEGEFERVVDAELRKEKYARNVSGGASEFVVGTEDYEEMRDVLSALLESKLTTAEQVLLAPKNASYNLRTDLDYITAPHRDEFHRIASLTVDVRLTAIERYDRDIARAVELLGQLAGAETNGKSLKQILRGSEESMAFLETLEAKTGIDPVELLESSAARRRQAIEGVSEEDRAEALDLREVWEGASEDNPIKQRIRSVRAAAETVQGLVHAAGLANVSDSKLQVSEITGSLDSAVDRLGNLQEILSSRSEAIADWVGKVLAEASALRVAEIKAVSFP